MVDVAPCFCSGQNSQSPIHLTCFSCHPLHSHVDPWHYTGDPSFHSDSTSSQFIFLCKSVLPFLEIPMKLGITGYLTVTEDNISNRWCTDSFGRISIIINNSFMFQRYTHGDILVEKVPLHGYKCLSSSRISDLITQL